MERHESLGDWLERAATRARVERRAVEDALALRQIRASPLPASPRRLLIRQVEFSGTKDQVPDAGPFEVKWGPLDRGLWGLVTDGNLKGKSTVFEVIRWLLRGRRSDQMQQDVIRWIARASLDFDIDAVGYRVEVNSSLGPEGRILVNDGNSGVRSLADFSDAEQFEALMADLFTSELCLDTIGVWQDVAGDEIGRAVVHSWPALSSVLSIGTDYTCVLGDLPPTSGVPTRLLQMYLGLPWVATLAAVKSALQATQQEHDIRERRRQASVTARARRLNELSEVLTVKRAELDALPDDSDVRRRVVELRGELAETMDRERLCQLALSRSETQAEQLASENAHDRRALQAHLDEQSAGMVFRAISPSCCPRCDVAISVERRKRENQIGACSVCGETLGDNHDGSTLLAQFTLAEKASRDARDKVRLQAMQIGNELETIRQRVVQLNTQMDDCARELNKVGYRYSLELDVARLEARMEEQNYEPHPPSVAPDDRPILRALIEELNAIVKPEQKSLLLSVSERLRELAVGFGMVALNSAELKGNLTLSLVKGGQHTSYSKVTPGEKLRLKVATVLAMISVAEAKGIGRHPGFLMIDSPGNNEVAPRDLEELIRGLDDIANEFRHLQVMIAARSSPAVLRHVVPQRRLHAHGDEPLW